VELERAGFLVRKMRSYGDLQLSEGHTAFVAQKPARDQEFAERV
jgi:hypothetical protein